MSANELRDDWIANNTTYHTERLEGLGYERWVLIKTGPDGFETIVDEADTEAELQS
jgi:hypothetical protein